MTITESWLQLVADPNTSNSGRYLRRPFGQLNVGKFLSSRYSRNPQLLEDPKSIHLCYWRGKGVGSWFQLIDHLNTSTNGGFFEDSNKLFGSTKCREVIEYLNNRRLLWKLSSPRSSLRVSQRGVVIIMC
jgi:hypothetical protein